MRISSIANYSGDPLLQGECDMIIFSYFFFLCPGDYTGSKSESTPFRLEDIAFSCGHSVFSETANEADLQAATVVMLALKDRPQDL